MEIIEINSPPLEEAFINVHRRLYKNNTDWVCPLDKDIKKVFDAKENFAFMHGEACRWILKDGKGKYVGRIAAFYNKANFKDNEKIGGVGFFECINDQNVANLLFDTAIKWLKSKGVNGVDGPINFGEKNAFWGLMVHGFKNPSYKENFNWPYYEQLFLSYGFKQITEQTTSEITYQSFDMPRFRKMAERVMQNPIYTFEHFKLNNIKKYAMDFVSVYNEAWAHREDFVAMTEDRIMAELKMLKPIIIEEAIWFAYANGRPIGFYVSVIDINQIFRHVNGRLNWLGIAKFLFYKTFAKVDRIRGEVFGVTPDFQEKGVETALIIHLYDSMQKYPHINKSELAWIGDFNPKMHGLFHKLGATTTKIHRTYRLQIA